MSKTDMAPAPINLFTSWISYFAKLCKKGKTGLIIKTKTKYVPIVARKSKVDDYPKFPTNAEGTWRVDQRVAAEGCEPDCTTQ